MVEAFTAASIPASQGARNLDEQRFRELGSFGRLQEKWKVFALQFCATVKEINPKLHSLIKWAWIEPEEITGDKVGQMHGEYVRGFPD